MTRLQSTIGILLVIAVPALAVLAQPRVTVVMPDGTSWSGPLSPDAPATVPSPATAPAPEPATLPTTLPHPDPLPPVEPPPTTLPTAPPADPNLILVPAGSDIAAALTKMGDGKTLALQAGGNWRVILRWNWSRATLTRYGDGPAPVLAGLKLAGPVTDCTFRGITLKGDRGYGLDWRSHKTERIRFENLTADGFSTCYSIHVPDLHGAPVAKWHRDILFDNCRATGARPDDPDDAFAGQGFFAANVDGLFIDGCHADDCGGLNAPNIYRHGYYLAAYLKRLVVRRTAATRCSSYGIQSRSDGATIDECAVYDCGMGIMLNGTEGNARGNVVIRGHGHGGNQSYGKGGFDLHIGTGVIADNLVVNGPQTMPAGHYMPSAFNVGYRKTRPDAQPWEWTSKFPDGTRRPLVTLGPGNVDRTNVVVTLDVAELLKLKPVEVAARIREAAR